MKIVYEGKSYCHVARIVPQLSGWTAGAKAPGGGWGTVQSEEHEPIRYVEVPQKAASAEEWVKEWATSPVAPLQDKGGGDEP
jgi:hypothetical protein